MWWKYINLYTLLNINITNLLLIALVFYPSYAKDMPKLVGSETNVTVVVGRDAILSCNVKNLQNYKIAWLRVDTQTILTIGLHVITKNHRVGVKCGDQAWYLTLHDVRLTDDGQYMCQINTDPMITQTHHLHVAVPPDIVNSSSRGEVIIHEGDDVSLHCTAVGTPAPMITWRREDSALMKIGTEIVSKWSGVWLNLTAVTRDMNGAFLCIATNGVPPSVSKRILLRVMCRPLVRVTEKMIGAYLGESALTKCKIEAFPPPVVYWTHVDGHRLQNGTKYQVIIKPQSYVHVAEFKVNNITKEDTGSYVCHAENPFGSSYDDVILHTLTTTTLTSTTRKSTSITSTTEEIQAYVELEVSVHGERQRLPEKDDFVVVLSQQHQMQNFDMSPSS